MRLSFFSLTVLIALCVAVTGCGLPSSQPPVTTLREASQKLTHIASEDYNLDALVKDAGSTVWIYVPIDKDIFEFKATPDGPVKIPQAEEVRTVQYLDTRFADGVFTIEYDIAPVKKYKVSPGFRTAYTPEYQRLRQNITQAIGRAYGQLGASASLPGDIRFADDEEQREHEATVRYRSNKEEPPEFFVVVITDVRSGIELRSFFYFKDLERGMTDRSFYEEYAKRLVSEEPKGYQDAVGDWSGDHVEAYPLTWGEFLARQMAHRINFKYRQSSFPPSADNAQEIRAIAQEAVEAYDFQDYRDIELIDLGE